MRKGKYAAELRGLVGRDLVKRSVVTEGLFGRSVKQVTWKVTEAYPDYVIAVRECDNGYKEKQCFNVGELVQMGLI